MKVAIINQHLKDKLGGSEIQCDLIARKFTESGYHVVYLAVKGTSEIYDVPYEVVTVDLENTLQFRDKLIKTGPDVVYWRYNKRAFVESMKVLNHLQVPVVFSISNKNDVKKYRLDLLVPADGIKQTLKNWRSFWLNYRQFKGFQYVDAVSSQCQNFMGSSGVGREMYFPNSVKDDDIIPFSWPKPYCMWVSRLKKTKNPEVYIKLAESLDRRNTDFLIVGEVQEAAYNYVKEGRNLPSNVHYLGVKSYGEVNGMIQNSLFLIHTCTPEGFPNNFIQAWAFGKPVVSLFYDPDGLIESEKLGFYSKTFGQFKKDVELLLDEPELRLKMGEAGKKITKEKFNLHKNAKKLESLMKDLVERKLQSATGYKKPV